MIKYDIKKHSGLNLFILWKNSITEKGYSCYPVIKGTYKECLLKLKEIKNVSC